MIHLALKEQPTLSDKAPEINSLSNNIPTFRMGLFK